MRAKDIMHKPVITVSPDMTLRELAALFIDKKISGAPVVDADGRLVGVVSQTDLVRREREASPPTDVPGYYRDEGKAAYAGGFQIEDPDFTRVRDVMTPAVISALDETPVRDLARCLLQHHIHRIVITRNGRLSGIVTSLDLLRVMVDAPARNARATAA